MTTSNEARRPVSDADNKMAEGYAFCEKSIIDEKMDQIGQLRDRHADYMASLPTEPIDALRTIRHSLNELDGLEVTSPNNAIRSVLTLLNELSAGEQSPLPVNRHARLTPVLG